MNYQHARCLPDGSKMLTETGLLNYWHDRCISGESKCLKLGTC